jgi:radical SAM superfamily enzyme YgiQ (UPF0313 family)
MPLLKLIQLPVPPPAAYAATGNVPLAAGYLAVAAQKKGLIEEGLKIEIVMPQLTDILGDALLIDLLAKDEPDYIGFSLYLWNTERSLYLMKAIKQRLPKALILIGGPEVNPDNIFMIENAEFDIAVTGEAEAVFAELMYRLLHNQSIDDLPAIAQKKNKQWIPFNPQGAIDFPLSDYPSPYLSDLIPVSPQRSTYIESVRGCRSKCTYCFYPRSSNVLRMLDVEATIDLIVALKAKGAREIVFLDPTLNHRTEFVKLLDRIAQINEDHSLTFFGEIRAEGMTEEIAKKLKLAGFDKLEIGLQSINQETLAKVKRFGKAEKVAEVAQILKEQGIDLLVDLIVGLPNDTPDDVRNGIKFLKDNDLGEFAQVFALSLLPGTEMRNTADQFAIEFEPAPPYRLIQTDRIRRDDIKELLDEAEELLDRRLDEYPRPHLVDDEPLFATFRHMLDHNSSGYIDHLAELLPMIPDRFEIDLDQDTPDLSALYYPSTRHTAIWVHVAKLENHLGDIQTIFQTRLKIDPYATVDLLLVPKQDFDLGCIDFLEYMLEQAPPSYLSRAQAHRGINMQRRLHFVLQASNQGQKLSKKFKKKLIEHASVYEEQSAEQALDFADQIGFDRPAALICDSMISAQIWQALIDQVDPESIAFKARDLERRWCSQVLSYGV